MLLAIVVVPAWAFRNDGNLRIGIFAPDRDAALIRSAVYSVLTPTGTIEAIRDSGTSPDVAVYPVWVSGPVVATADRSLPNQVADASATSLIAVIYPDMAEPYRSVFAQIIDGIRANSKGPVADYPVGAKSDIRELDKTLRHRDAKVVIALGRQGMKAASSLDGDIGVVVGCVLNVPEDEEGKMQINSLSPDPGLLFSRLKGMMPRVKRIYTVYDSRQNAWIIRLAKEAARAQGLELTAYDARDLRSAMRAYTEIFDKADSSKDALWLPQDSTTVEEGTVLPMVLQESWNRNVAVFSSSFAHVRRGALFSLYPDNVELGRHLADSAIEYLSSGASKGGIVPLREVQMAVNLRTAKHLGIDADRQRNIDMVFPQE